MKIIYKLQKVNERINKEEALPTHCTTKGSCFDTVWAIEGWRAMLLERRPTLELQLRQRIWNYYWDWGWEFPN